MSADWIVYGQTQLNAQSSVDNPVTNQNGLIGEHTLPYVVPSGYNLVLTGWGFEGLTNAFGVCIPWIGSGPPTNAKCLASVGTGPGSYYVTDMRWVIPEGKIVNIRLINGSSVGSVCAWMCQGKLEVAS